MSTLTASILEGLLSPDPIVRSLSEAVLAKLRPDEKCRELLRVFCANAISKNHSDYGRGGDFAAANEEDSPLPQLIGVLLRREILKVQSAATLAELVGPLLQIFVDGVDDVEEQARRDPHYRTRSPLLVRVRRKNAARIGDCLASALQGLEQHPPVGDGGGDGNGDGDGGVAAAYSLVLSAVAAPASRGQVECLSLLAELARSSPRTYCISVLPSLSGLVGSVLSHFNLNGSGAANDDEKGGATALAALAHLVVQSAMAAETVVVASAAAAAETSGPSAAAAATRAPVPLWLAAAIPPGEKAAAVDPDSVSAQLGEACWLPILRHLAERQCAAASASSTIASRMLAPFLLMAEWAPSLAVRGPVLRATLQYLNGAIRSMGAADPPLSGGDASELLTVVNVVATLLDGRPELRQRVVLSDADGGGGGGGGEVLSTSNELLEACLVSCLRTMARCGSCTVVEAGLYAFDDDDTQDGEDEDDVIDHATYAESLLETLVRSLGAPAVQVVLSHVSAHQQQQHPIHAASPSSSSSSRWCLAALRCCALAAPAGLAPHARAAGEWALATAGLPPTGHGARATAERCESIALLGALVEQYPELRQEYAARILGCFQSTLAGALPGNSSSAAPSSAVCNVTCRALVSFCRGPGDGAPHELVDSQLVLPHLPALLSTMIHMLQQPATRIAIRSSLVSTVACLATVAGPEFRGYYSSVMPVLLQHIGNPCQVEHLSRSSYAISELRGSALESATVIGQAVDDAELFGADAIQLLQFATQQLDASLQTGDCCLPHESVLLACARIASVLKEAYAPYADPVLSHLLKRATDPSDVEVSDVRDSEVDAAMRRVGCVELDEDAGSESMTVALPGRGLTQVTIHTNAIHGKVQAIRALYEHAVALGRLFSPWSELTIEALKSMVDFAYSADVRGSVCQTLSAVFESSCLHGVDVGSMVFPGRYFSPLLRSISKQLLNEESTLDVETLHAEAEALSNIHFNAYQHLEVYRDQLLSQYDMNDALSVVQHCMTSLVACLDRRSKIASAMFGVNGLQPTHDEVRVYEQTLQGEEALLTPLVDSIGYNLKFFRHDFAGVFDSIVAPVLAPYLSQGVDVRARVAAICLFDDCVEHCGAMAAEKFAPILAAGAIGVLEGDGSTNHDLLAASVYGIAQICRHASSALFPYQDRVMRGLRSILQGVKDDENEAVYENAVSAVASLLLFGPAIFSSSRIISRDEFLPVLLRNLPLQTDYDESRFSNAGLCDLVEKGYIPMNSSTSMELLRIAGESLAMVEDGDVVASPETCLRFASILFRMQSETPREILQERFSVLSPDAQAAVHKAMGQYASQLGAVITP